MRFLILILTLSLAILAPASAATVVVYPNGTATVTVPASQYINVFASASASVYKQVGYPNMPSAWVLETNGSVSAAEVQFGPYTTATQIRISAGIAQVLYSIGSGGLAIPCSRTSVAMSPSIGTFLRSTARLSYSQPVPTALTGSATLTSAQLLTGILTDTHVTGSTATYTLPTGTLLEAAVPQLQIGEGFEWTFINLSLAAADTATLAAGTNHTIVGVALIPSTHATTGGLYGSSVTWITTKTAANTFVTYRKN